MVVAPAALAPAPPLPQPSAQPLLPPPPAAIVRAAGLRGRNTVRCAMGSGFIVKNASSLSLDARCQTCGAAVTRKLESFPKARSLKTQAQGRPMGTLIAFLKQPCIGDAEHHRGMLATLTHAERLAARQGCLDRGECVELFSLERAEGAQDDRGEPILIP